MKKHRIYGYDPDATNYDDILHYMAMVGQVDVYDVHGTQQTLVRGDGHDR